MRFAPRPRTLFQAAVLGTLAVLVSLGITALVLRDRGPSDSLEIRLPSPTAQPEAVVYVTGAGAQPGLVRLLEGDRVGDAIARAGGLAADADTVSINLAAKVADGDHVHVPRIGESVTTVAGAPPSSTTSEVTPINLNTATIAQLDALPGIGTVRAQAIVAYRDAHGGAFQRVDDLLLVPGIGQVTLERLKPYVMVK